MSVRRDQSSVKDVLKTEYTHENGLHDRLIGIEDELVEVVNGVRRNCLEWWQSNFWTDSLCTG